MKTFEIEALRKTRIFAIGKNSETLNLSAKLPVDGIIDDSAQYNEFWKGIPVVKPTAITSAVTVVNCSTSIAPTSAGLRVLSLLPQVKLIAYWNLTTEYPEYFPAPNFVNDMQEDFKINKSRWEKIDRLLADQLSKKTFNEVREFRLSGNPNILSGYTVRLKEQYFEPFLALGSGEVFVDCGGFDGDTSEEFIKRCPDFGEIYFFEPSEKNMCKATERLPSNGRIHFFHEGISDSVGFLSFDPDSGSASSVSEDPTVKIPVTTLDDKISKPVSFIKMDLEGWELPALRGARRHILEDHPKLAVAVYHRARDFWEIPEFILGIRNDYKIHVRHYTEGWSETVMFFIPHTKNA